MDRESQIKYLEGCEDRVRSYAQNWLQDPQVKAAVHSAPVDPHGDGANNDDHHLEPQRRFG